MPRKFGFELLVEQTADAVAQSISSRSAWVATDTRLGESPIERLMWLALVARTRFDDEGERFWTLGIVGPALSLDGIKAQANFRDLLVLQQQVNVDGVGRVDFMIHAWGDWPREPEGGVPGWRRLIIECDGHDFHERTKEQAAKDRSRDRAATLGGIEVLRFTGSELWRDPWGCAGQVMAWANRGA